MGEPWAAASAVGEEEEERLSRFPLDNGKERVWGGWARARGFGKGRSRQVRNLN